MDRDRRDREAELETIRETYGRYAHSGREQIWSDRNQGFRYLKEQRDGRLVDLLRQSVPTDGTVLDAGCGRGDLAGLIHAQRPDIGWTGVDLLQESIVAAQQTFPWALWIVGSADDIPLPDRSVDAIVAETLFSSLPTEGLERDVAAELARLLKPGGWAIWYDLRRNSPGNNTVHGLDSRRVARLFPGWHQELETMTLIPPLARRLGSLASGLYPALHRVRWLRSHLVGRIQRPAVGSATTPLAVLRKVQR